MNAQLQNGEGFDVAINYFLTKEPDQELIALIKAERRIGWQSPATCVTRHSAGNW